MNAESFLTSASADEKLKCVKWLALSLTPAMFPYASPYPGHAETVALPFGSYIFLSAVPGELFRVRTERCGVEEEETLKARGRPLGSEKGRAGEEQ